MNRFANLSFLLIFSLFLSACVSQIKPDFDQQQAAKARIELALGYLADNNFAQAKLNLDKALAYAPDYYLPHSALAYFYQKQNLLEQANSAYLNALKLDPMQGDVLNNYGAFLCSKKEYEQAYQQFEKALNMKGYYQQADTYENLAICAFKGKNQQVLDKSLQRLEKINAERADAIRKKLK